MPVICPHEAREAVSCTDAQQQFDGEQKGVEILNHASHDFVQAKKRGTMEYRKDESTFIIMYILYDIYIYILYIYIYIYHIYGGFTNGEKKRAMTFAEQI